MREHRRDERRQDSGHLVELVVHSGIRMPRGAGELGRPGGVLLDQFRAGTVPVDAGVHLALEEGGPLPGVHHDQRGRPVPALFEAVPRDQPVVGTAADGRPRLSAVRE